MSKLEITKTFSFKLRASHKLITDDPRSKKENTLHGHEYKINICLAGAINNDSGLLIQRDLVNKVVQEEIITKYDKKNLNNYFKNTSGENLSLEFYNIIKKSKLGNNLKNLVLTETDKNNFGTFNYG